MLVIDPTAPPAFELMAEWLGLAYACEGISSSFIDEPNQTLEEPWVTDRHHGEVLPRIRVEGDDSYWNCA